MERGFRISVLVATLACVVACPTAASGSGDEPDASLSQPSAATGHSYLGVMVQLGAPDFLGLSLIGRPVRSLRLALGAGTTLSHVGIQGGVTYVPFNYWVSPSATVEGGHFFEADANRLTRPLGLESDSLERFSYSFASAHLGIELGSSEGFMFFIHGGVSLVAARMGGFETAIEQGETSGTVTSGDPWIKVFGPSAKIGFVYHL